MLDPVPLDLTVEVPGVDVLRSAPVGGVGDRPHERRRLDGGRDRHDLPRLNVGAGADGELGELAEEVVVVVHGR